MGWLDYHLHEFRLLDAAEQNVVSIGIPTDDDPNDRPVVPGWQMPLSKFFDQRNRHDPPATYAYDFGDDWQHVLVHEGFESADDDRKHPQCVAGEGRCPPDDCGGVHGYAEFLQVIADPIATSEFVNAVPRLFAALTHGGGASTLTMRGCSFSFQGGRQNAAKCRLANCGRLDASGRGAYGLSRERVKPRSQNPERSCIDHRLGAAPFHQSHISRDRRVWRSLQL